MSASGYVFKQSFAPQEKMQFFFHVLITGKNSELSERNVYLLLCKK